MASAPRSRLSASEPLRQRAPRRPDDDRFYRLAVAQIDSHPAFCFKGYDLLCEPWFLEPEKLCLDKLTPTSPAHRKQLQELRQGILRAYCAVLEKRVHAIVDWCAEQRVELLAFPEYSIPAQLLPKLHQKACDRALTIIAGTHHVTPSLISQGTYDNFVEKPGPGMAVAPILGLNEPRLVSKLTLSQWEQGSLEPGHLWELVPWSDEHQFAVLICLDRLHPESSGRERLVNVQLKQAAFQVVISLTPKHSTDQFEKSLLGELKSYHRPALFVNSAASGGSQIFVVKSPAGPQPEPLCANEEQVLVWDIRLRHHALSKPTGSEFREPARHYATVNLIERNTLPGFVELVRQVESQESIMDVTRLLESQREQLERWCSLPTTPPSVKHRFGLLLERLGRLTSLEAVHKLLRNIPLAADVPTLHELRRHATDRALREVRLLLDDGERNPATLAASTQLEELQHKLRARTSGGAEQLEQELTQLAQTWREPQPVARPAKPEKVAKPKRAAKPSPVASAPAAPAAPAAPTPEASIAEALPAAPSDDLSRIEPEIHSELGYPPLPHEEAYRGTPMRVWALLHEQRCYLHSNAGPIASCARLGRGRGWLLRAACRTPEGIDFLWWHDQVAGRERLEIIPDTCEKNFEARLRSQKQRLASIAALLDWDEQWTAPKLRQELQRLLTLESHARELVAKYDSDANDLPRRYIPLSVSRGSKPSQQADQFLDDWWQRGQAIGVLVGDFGGGKTTTLRRFARDSAQRFLAQPAQHRAPVLVDLRTTEHSDDPIVLARLALKLADTRMDDLVRLALEHGLVGVLYDGLDEQLRPDRSKPLPQLQAFRSCAATAEARLLLSARTRLFARDAQDFFSAVPALLPATYPNRAVADLAALEPFDASRIRQYLDASTPEQATALERFIDATPGMQRLAEQPLLLSLIVALSSQILASGQRELAVTTLYQQYADEWLHDRVATRIPAERERLACLLAWVLWHRGQPSLHDAQPKPDWQELGSAPFLRIGPEGSLSFVHTSFLEYFLALGILRRLEDDKTWPLPQTAISPEVATFLVGLFQQYGSKAGATLDALSRKGESAARRAAAICASYLVHASRSGIGVHLRDILATAWGEELRLDGSKLSAQRLPYASLRRAHLAGADLSGCDLEGADLSGAMLSQARLDGLKAPEAIFRGAQLGEASMDTAQLRGAIFQDADLREASLCGCELTHSSLCDAQLEGARLRGCDLTEADLSGAAATGADFSFATFDRTRVTAARFSQATWSAASLRETDVQAIVDAPSASALAQYPPRGPFEIYARPVDIGGVRSLFGPKLPLSFVASSPSGDLIFLASSQAKAGLRRTYVIDAHSGQLVTLVDETVQALFFTESGTAAYAVCADRVGLLLDGQSGSTRFRHRRPYQDPRHQFVVDGSRLVVDCADEDGTVVRVLDAADGRTVHVATGIDPKRTFFCASPGPFVLIPLQNAQVRVVDARDGRVVCEQAGHAEWSQLSVSGCLAAARATSSNARRSGAPFALTVRFFESTNGVKRGPLEIAGVLSPPSISADGQWLVVATQEGEEDYLGRSAPVTVRIFHLRAEVPRLQWEQKQCVSFRLAAQTNQLAILSTGGSLNIHRLDNGQRTHGFDGIADERMLPSLDYRFNATDSKLFVRTKDHRGNASWVSQELSIPTDGSWRQEHSDGGHENITLAPIKTGANDGGLELKDNQRILLRMLHLPTIRHRQFLSNDRLLVVHSGGLLRVFKLPSCDLLLEHQAGAVSDLALFSDDQLCLRTSAALDVVDLTRGPRLTIPIRPDTKLRYSPEGGYVAAFAESPSQLSICSLANGQRTASIAIDEPADARWFFLREERLLVLDDENRLRLFDTATGRVLLNVIVRVWGVSPDNTFLLVQDRLSCKLYATADVTTTDLGNRQLAAWAWSADEAYLAYSDSKDIVVRELATGGVSIRTDSEVQEMLTVSDNGELLLVRRNQALGILSKSLEFTPLAKAEELDRVNASRFSPSGTRLLLRSGLYLFAFAVDTGQLLWDTSHAGDAFSRIRLRHFYDAALPAFAPDGLTLIDAEGEHFSLDSGKFLPGHPMQASPPPPPKYQIEDRDDGSLFLRDGAARWTGPGISLYPSGPLPYAVSSTGALTLPDKWKTLRTDLRFDLVTTTGRLPLAGVVDGLGQPQLNPVYPETRSS